MIEIQIDNNKLLPNILVLGVGGGGNNAVNRMANEKTPNVTYACINTDLHVLEGINCHEKLQIGGQLTGGHGAGADPSVGQSAAEESIDEIENLLSGYQMVILACGMGGGTGTGASPIIAKISRQLKILTMAVVTLPFSFEGQPRALIAKEGLEKLDENVDTLLVLPNDKLLSLSEKKLSVKAAFDMADSILKYTIFGITNVIYQKGTLNLDFNDLRTVLLGKGRGHLGIGTVTADGCVIDAVKQAIESPLLDTTIVGATHILLNISGDVNLSELDEAVSHIRQLSGDHTNILWGTVGDENTDPDKIIVTLIATGMPKNSSAGNIPPIPKRRPTLTSTVSQNNRTVTNYDKSRPVLKQRQGNTDLKMPAFLLNHSR